MKPIPYFDGHAAFRMRLAHLVEAVSDQIEATLRASGIAIPGTATAELQLLYHGGPQPLVAIATQLDISHQLATQRVQRLAEAGLAQIEVDPADRRRRRVSLTCEGRAQGDRFQAHLAQVERAFSELFEEIGIDADRAVRATAAALSRRSLADRIRCGG